MVLSRVFETISRIFWSDVDYVKNIQDLREAVDCDYVINVYMRSL